MSYSDKEEKSLYENFDKDMETILSKSYRKDLMNKLNNINEQEESVIKAIMSHHKYNNSQELFKKLDDTILGHDMETSKLKSKDSDLVKMESESK